MNNLHYYYFFLVLINLSDTHTHFDIPGNFQKYFNFFFVCYNSLKNYIYSNNCDQPWYVRFYIRFCTHFIFIEAKNIHYDDDDEEKNGFNYLRLCNQLLMKHNYIPCR